MFSFVEVVHADAVCVWLEWVWDVLAEQCSWVVELYSWSEGISYL